MCKLKYEHKCKIEAQNSKAIEGEQKVMQNRETTIILRTLFEKPESTQRDLAETLGVSLGKTNQLLQGAVDQGSRRWRRIGWMQPSCWRRASAPVSYR